MKTTETEKVDNRVTEEAVEETVRERLKSTKIEEDEENGVLPGPT